MDRISVEQRSRNMAAVKSRGNKSTEERLAYLFRVNKITGWRRHVERLAGRPDFTFEKQKVVVFVDGCFWHGCKKCFTIPKTNTVFWNKKISDNRIRDKVKRNKLKKDGWRVVRVWEHELKQYPETVIESIRLSL